MYKGLNFDFIVLPRNEPRISGGKKTYYIGDRVRVNCTSARSKPAAVLHWFINNKPVISYLCHVEYKFLLLYQKIKRWNWKTYLFQVWLSVLYIFIFNIESRKHVYRNKSFLFPFLILIRFVTIPGAFSNLCLCYYVVIIMAIGDMLVSKALE